MAARAHPPTSASRQQQRIRMIRQCCSTFTHHIPAMENTWRPRWSTESFETYRERVVDKGDGDLFRCLQLLEQSLSERTQLLLGVLQREHAPLAAHLSALQEEADALALERVHVAPRTFGQFEVGGCTQCKCVWVRAADDAADGAADGALCDVCRHIASSTRAWAPQMPIKLVRLHKKKRRKKKKRVLAPPPSDADLQRLMQQHPDLKRTILGQPPLTGPSSSAASAQWCSPFDDPYARLNHFEL